MGNGTKLITKTAVSAFLSVLVIAVATAKIIYVDDDATGANNGSSWVDAYNYLQDAFADANSAEKPVEIRLAQGVYKPDQGAGITPGDREATFQLINGVTLKGGYAGFGEPNPNARDVRAYETILSGDLNGDDTEVSEPGNLPNDPNHAENSYHVVTGSGTDPNAVLDGFVITAGMANAYQPTQQDGGGVYNDYGSPTFRNCKFLRNMANDGGGVSNWDASPVFMNCIFMRNEAVRREAAPITVATSGGGVCNIGSSNPVFINCAFWGNRAGYGGAIITWDESSSTLYNCTLSGNMAKFGGALYNYSYSSAITTIINSVLWGNEATINQDEILTGSLYPSTTIVSYTCIEGDHPGTGNIDRNPRFVSGPLGDYYLSQKSAGQWLDSPCVDAGSNTASNLEMSRFTTRTDEVGDQGIVDMGYHYLKSIPADLDNNRQVNLIDYAMLASAWRSKTEDAQWNSDCDISELADNFIDMRDLIIFTEGWLAGVSPKEDGNVEGFETGDFSKFDWTFSGAANWFVTSKEAHSGIYSARAGEIGSNRNTALQITLDCVAENIVFYVKVSSESRWDYLKFYIDDEEKGEWSGQKNWMQVSFPVMAGTRTFKWVYSKDSSMSEGSDTAWIDDIIFPIN